MSKDKLPVADPEISPKSKEFVNDCLDKNMISWRGEYVERFEEELARLLDVEYAILVSNGTAALHIAAMALEDTFHPYHQAEFIVPSFTFIASIVPGIYMNRDTFIEDIESKAWSLNTKNMLDRHDNTIAIPVAISGFMWNTDALLDIKRNSINFKILADMAQGLGSHIDGFTPNAFADVCTYSFFANKFITSGEGGAITTNDPEIYEYCKRYRSLPTWDLEDETSLRYLGNNYRPTNIQAALLLGQLYNMGYIKHWKKVACMKYKEALSYNGYHFQEKINQDESPAEWMFRISSEEVDMKSLSKELKSIGVETKPLYTPLHVHPSLDKYEGELAFQRDDYPNANKLNGFYLPTHRNVTDEWIEKIQRVFKKHSIITT